MNYKIIKIFFMIFLIYGCDQITSNNSKKINISFEDKYKNAGFALVYNEDIKNIKKLDQRSLDIYHNKLKKKSLVKIINPVNGKFLIAKVKSNKQNFSNFYNSILSQRIADTLELDLDEPYIEIILISKNSTFIAKKAKTFDEEKNVAEKAPIDGIQINDLNKKKTIKKYKKDKSFSYSIKIADFYYKTTADVMVKKIYDETSLNNINIEKLSKTRYRVLIGPFNDIKNLKKSFEQMNILNFENLEILKNV
ncbi:hypothetical protein IDH20_00795 [Pelagibacterales bacterium SAG-MED39]|nr:hypothetical protein [Pelagibacterales bacterium SAG-MED39]